ncbi:cobalamin-5'-phosphate synthase [Rhizobium sp. RU35A]|nr:cobalamin-5'-phosphate synthase [Rhizobium sp. RU35A]
MLLFPCPRFRQRNLICWSPVYQASTEEQLPNAAEFFTDLARSIAFLSRLPVPARVFEGHDGSSARACRAFPLAGWLVALAPALVLATFATSPAVDPLAALLALGLMTLLTGGLHEDGLADASDGLLGGRDRDQALLIMKDSRIGSFGVIALILSFGLRASALVALSLLVSPGLGAGALLAAAAVSRALMVWHWRALPPARANGTAVAVGQPLPEARTLALVTGFGLSLLLVPAGLPLLTLFLALALSTLGATLFTRFVRQRIGGHTGDTIGATQQITETILLCTLAVAV